MADPQDYNLSLDALVRSFAVNRGARYAFFLGAGASISSGVLSAQQCIWEWKRSIFLSHHPGLEQQFSELSLAGVKEHIQSWLDSTGHHPPCEDPSEYGHYIEQCYPIIQDRRRYFQERIRQVRPHIGYRLLAFLAEMQMVASVWTTNFDGLAANAAVGSNVTAVEVGIDCAADRLPRQARQYELLCVALHGDYRYDQLKNTDEEVREQDAHLREALIEQFKEMPCVCVGYSGRDASVMEAISVACEQAGTGALYWCTYGESPPPTAVSDLIRRARDQGREAYVVPTQGFDDLMVRLARHTASDAERKRVDVLLASYTESQRLRRTPFSLPDHPAGAVIKSNIFGLDCPSELYVFGLKNWPQNGVWKWLREKLGNSRVCAVPFHGEVLALGLIDDIKEVFSENIQGEIKRTSIQDSEYQYEDGAVVSLMRASLVLGLIEGTQLEHDRRRMIWDPMTRRVERGVRIHEAVELSLRRVGSQKYLVLMPTLHIDNKDGSRPDRSVIQSVRFHALGRQYNSQFNDAVNAWRKRLLQSDQPQRTIEYPPGSGSGFRFKVRRAPVFAEVGEPGRRKPIDLDSIPAALRQQKATLVQEPNLKFSRTDGQGATLDTHALRGVVQNRPYDFTITRQALNQVIRLGVICPQPEQQQLHEYLHTARQRHAKGRPNAEYLFDYPGFQQAFGIPLEIPDIGSAGWHTCPEPQGQSAEEGAVALGRLITTAVNQLQASSSPDAVIVYVPDRWEWFRGFRSEKERFDLHDFVKAYCVQRGIPTQFLNQPTLVSSGQCEVWWWIALALYVKSMRTPWILDGMDDDTAFVGIGFSVDTTRDRGSHVILGCSHIYSASGEGLQYRLSKVEQPKIIRGNPFMSEDDARRLGETIRHLFYESRSALPRRVVLHKRTPYRREEREGIGQGLSGIDAIDMLEVSIARSMRYVSAHGSGRKADNFPVRRGTTVRLDDYAALTWVHGVTDAVTPGRRYYQGRRRIPTPLLLRRYAGHTPLDQLAFEIMGLSKMNWNTFDMYTKLPATLQSSSEIARIGPLLERFGTASYDYRLFM